MVLSLLTCQLVFCAWIVMALNMQHNTLCYLNSRCQDSGDNSSEQSPENFKSFLQTRSGNGNHPITRRAGSHELCPWGNTCSPEERQAKLVYDKCHRLCLWVSTIPSDADLVLYCVSQNPVVLKLDNAPKRLGLGNRATHAGKIANLVIVNERVEGGKAPTASQAYSGEPGA